MATKVHAFGLVAILVAALLFGQSGNFAERRVPSSVSRSVDPPRGGVINPARLPWFNDFRVDDILRIRPVPPKIIRPGDRLFRTRIREGAAKGPNFAGHYTVAEWGCGSGCRSIALVDARTGEIFSAPFRALEWGMPVLTYEGRYAPNAEGFRPLEYRLNSRLLVARGCPENRACASYFYEWTGSEFRLIRKLPAQPTR